jgi:hypothetical protein
MCPEPRWCAQAPLLPPILSLQGHPHGPLAAGRQQSPHCTPHALHLAASGDRAVPLLAAADYFLRSTCRGGAAHAARLRAASCPAAVLRLCGPSHSRACRREAPQFFWEDRRTVFANYRRVPHAPFEAVALASTVALESTVFGVHVNTHHQPLVGRSRGHTGAVMCAINHCCGATGTHRCVHERECRRCKGVFPPSYEPARGPTRAAASTLPGAWWFLSLSGVASIASSSCLQQAETGVFGQVLRPFCREGRVRRGER